MRQTSDITATTAPARIVRRHRHQGDAGHHHGHEDAHDHAADQRQPGEHQTARHPRPAPVIVTAIAIIFCLAFTAAVAGQADAAAGTADAGTADAWPSVGDRFTGPARIIDGDTLQIGAQSIRLFGIDTPERGQPGFAAATEHLRRIVGGRRITCATVDVDRYRRAVGLCRIGVPPAVTEQQETLSEAMLATCLARRLANWDRVVRPAMRRRLNQAAAGCGG